MSEEKIIEIRASPKGDLEIIRRYNDSSEPCYDCNRAIEVDSEERIIRCQKCRRVLDSFDYLKNLAISGERIMKSLEQSEVQRKINNAENEDLKKRIKNARATLKRNKGLQPKEVRDQFNILRWNSDRNREEVEGLHEKVEGDWADYYFNKLQALEVGGHLPEDFQY